jgi:hypothetical protein
MSDTVRLIGRCPRCKAAVAEDLGQRMERKVLSGRDREWTVLVRPDGSRFPHFLTCACGMPVRNWRQVEGTQTDQPCGAACRDAKEWKCICSCGGANHGIAHVLCCLVVLLALSAFCVGCGGGGAARDPGSVGPVPGGEGGSAIEPIAPTEPQPQEPQMLPGDRFGILNMTGGYVTSFGWWETQRGPEPHWFDVVPFYGPVATGETFLKSIDPMPPEGPLTVRAFTFDGREIVADVVYAPTSSAVWVVR